MQTYEDDSPLWFAPDELDLPQTPPWKHVPLPLEDNTFQKNKMVISGRWHIFHM
jgi:hypothetical protein